MKFSSSFFVFVLSLPLTGTNTYPHRMVKFQGSVISLESIRKYGRVVTARKLAKSVGFRRAGYFYLLECSHRGKFLRIPNLSPF